MASSEVRPMRRGLLTVAVMIAVAALACAAPPAAPGPQEPGSPTPGAAQPTPTPEPGTPSPKPDAPVPEPAVPEGARPLVDIAKSDLSRRKGVATDQIRVVSIEEVDWPNGSLGFPKPGMVYIQVIIPGYRIVLTDGSQNYEYHADMGQRVEHGDR